LQPSLTQFLGRLIHETTAEQMTSKAIERAKVSLVHNSAVALAGRNREQIAYRIAEASYASPAGATLLHNGARVTTEGAAFANGALFHARSQDDTHPDSTSHPGSPVMAAALAVAEERGASGREFLEAVILGYEVLCRVGRDFDQQVTGRGYRAAAVFGGFGAAAATARLMKLDAEQTGHALGLVTHLSGGLSQVWHEGSAEFPLQLGFAARNGIVAARAAAAGATAAIYALDGPRGFFNAYAGATEPAKEAIADYGHWQIEEVTVKPYPACAILQGPLQLLCRMIEDDGLSASDVEHLVLELNPYEARYTGIDNAGPFVSATATKMSAQFCLGNALALGRLALADLERVADPAVLAEAAKIKLVENPEVPERLCRITIRTATGSEIARSLDEAVGRPSPAEIHAFAIGLAGEIAASAEEMNHLVAQIEAVDKAPDISALIAAAAGMGGQSLDNFGSAR